MKNSKIQMLWLSVLAVVLLAWSPAFAQRNTGYGTVGRSWRYRASELDAWLRAPMNSIWRRCTIEPPTRSRVTKEKNGEHAAAISAKMFVPRTTEGWPGRLAFPVQGRASQPQSERRHRGAVPNQVGSNEGLRGTPRKDQP